MLDERLLEKGYPKPRNPQVPFCTDPVTIVNPKLPEYFLTHLSIKSFNVDGEEVICKVPHYIKIQSSVKVTKRLLLQWLRVFVRKLQISYFVDCYGECIDSTMYVPCGHCLCCLDRKRKRLTSMCQMEAQQHNSLPLFLTLTYDNEHLPEEGLLETDAVPEFLKRVRASLDKKGIKHNIRTFYCGEYGTKTQRPHYHIEMFGFPMEDFDNNIIKVSDYLSSKWYNGYLLTKPCNDDKVGQYISKYMTKQVDRKYKEFKVKPFVRHSINMGVNFVAKVVNDVIDKTEGNFQTIYYKDKFTGKCNVLPFNSYYMNKLLPSQTQVSADVRNGALYYKSLGYDVCFFENADIDMSYFKKANDYEAAYMYNKFQPTDDYNYNGIFREKWYSSLKEQIGDKSPSEYAYVLSKRFAKEKDREIF